MSLPLLKNGQERQNHSIRASSVTLAKIRNSPTNCITIFVLMDVACWYSSENISPAPWKEELRENLKTCERVLDVVSQRSLESKGVKAEINEVLEKHETQRIFDHPNKKA